MRRGYDIRQDGTAAARRDARWAAAVRLEIVRAIAERERHSLAPNVVAWAVCAAAAITLPYTAALALPLLSRVAAMISTRCIATALRRRLAARSPVVGTLRWLGASMGFAGVTWALLLWPVLDHPPEFGVTYAPAAAIVGVTTIAVSMIAAMMAPLPRIMASFVCCFSVTLALGAVLSSAPVSPWAVLAVIGMAGGLTAFALGSARDNRTVAEALVDNSRLGEELAEALAQAEFLSLRDPLTGLANRRAFFEGDDQPATVSQVLAIDLDHFKRINDGFGHAGGDRVLVAVAGVLRDVVRELPGEGHRAARLGGEEFVLQLAGLTRPAAAATADALRVRIGAVASELAIPGLVVSASIGVAECAAGCSLDTALHEADAALYRAKAAGRDRVMQAAA